MKVIKRDGRIVNYDRAKVITCIEKANAEVMSQEKANKEEIKTITAYIEDLDKKRILVEDIQDIIEEKLMELGKDELAKKYVGYSYNRETNTVANGSILEMISNKSKEVINDISNKTNVTFVN